MYNHVKIREKLKAIDWLDKVMEICRKRGVIFDDAWSSRRPRAVALREEIFSVISGTEGWSDAETGVFFGMDASSMREAIIRRRMMVLGEKTCRELGVPNLKRDPKRVVRLRLLNAKGRA